MNILFKLMMIIVLVNLVSCSSVSSRSTNANPPVSSTTPIAFNEESPTSIWNKLQHTSIAKLTTMQSKTNDPIAQAWIQLALITKQKNMTSQEIAKQLIAWHTQHENHPANHLLPRERVLMQLQSSQPPHQIAILLPQNGSYSAASQKVREGFLNAYYANLSHTDKQNIKFYDTSQSDNIIALYRLAISEGADFVVGPLSKDQVQKLSSAGSSSIPTITLNYTDRNRTSFYQFGLLPEDEAGQIADRARAAGRSHALIIAPQTVWGKRLVTAFTARWQTIGGQVQEAWYYTANANYSEEVARLLKVNPEADKKLMKENNNKTLLEQQRRHDFDVIFLFSQPQEARIIVPLLRYYYASDIPVYATSAVYSGQPNPVKDVDLNGVIVCDIPWDKPAGKNSLEETASLDRMYAVGQDAYLLTESLARLQSLPQFPLYGSTGALTLAQQNQIHRRLPCIAIQNGLLE